MFRSSAVLNQMHELSGGRFHPRGGTARTRLNTSAFSLHLWPMSASGACATRHILKHRRENACTSACPGTIAGTAKHADTILGFISLLSKEGSVIEAQERLRYESAFVRATGVSLERAGCYPLPAVAGSRTHRPGEGALRSLGAQVVVRHEARQPHVGDLGAPSLRQQHCGRWQSTTG